MTQPHPPTKRSFARRWLGRMYHTMQRHLYWHTSDTPFARREQAGSLAFSAMSHRSVLRRPLKDVEKWMQENKVQNLRLAIQQLNGLKMHPGQTFSYWKLIGKPTRRRGFVEGMVLVRGEVKAGIGGGLCQLSNLLFWMTLHTPLTVIERWRHSYDVFPDVQRTLPFGSGATCSYPNIDLQIRNDTCQTFQLHLSLTDTHLVGEWRSDMPATQGYIIEEKNHVIRHELFGVYTRHNELWRTATDVDGASHPPECVCKNDAIMMYNPLLDAPV